MRTTRILSGFVLLATAIGAGAVLSCSTPTTPATTGATAPTAPTAVTAMAGNGTVTIDWTPVAGATSYNLYWSVTPGVTATNGTKIELETTAYVHVGRAPGVTYYYVVTAVNGVGESATSPQVSATAEGPPVAPIGVTATPGNTVVTIAWPSVAGATSYNIDWESDPAHRGQIAGAASPYVQAGLSDGITYSFIVTAVNRFGASPGSVAVSATPVAPPLAPAEPTVLAGNSQVIVGWSPSAGASWYNLYWATSVSGPYTRIANLLSSPFVHTGLSNGTPYYYSVTAENAGGESARTAPVVAMPRPPAPGGLYAVPGNSQVALHWAWYPGLIIRYYIYWSTAHGVTPANGTRTSAPGNANYYTHIGLTNGTTYYYVITAVYAGVETAPSEEVSATPN